MPRRRHDRTRLSTGGGQFGHVIHRWQTDAAGEPALRARWKCAPGRPMPPDAGRTTKARKEEGEYEPGEHDHLARICDRRTEVLAELADADAARRDPHGPHSPAAEQGHRGV